MKREQTSPPTAPGMPPADAGACAAAALEAELPVLRQRLLRYARLSVHDASLAEDLVQDTLLVVVEKYSQRRGEASLVTWSAAILKNKIADWYRSPGRKRMVQFGADDEALGTSVDALFDAQGAYLESVPVWQQPEGREEQRQIMTVLERCMRCLPPQTGNVFMMREWMGFETKEICQQLGLKADHCRVILHRARMALRQCIQRDGSAAKAKS